MLKCSFNAPLLRINILCDSIKTYVSEDVWEAPTPEYITNLRANGQDVINQS